MLANIDVNSSVPVYIQIENEVRFGIASGKLKADDRLPSVRELSERIKVNPNTVAKSYRDLEVMGLVYTRQGMGVYIAKGVVPRCREDVARMVADHLHEAIGEAKSAGYGVKDIKELVSLSLTLNTSTYGDPPKELVDLAKKFKPKGA